MKFKVIGVTVAVAGTILVVAGIAIPVALYSTHTGPFRTTTSACKLSLTIQPLFFFFYESIEHHLQWIERHNFWN